MNESMGPASPGRSELDSEIRRLRRHCGDGGARFEGGLSAQAPPESDVLSHLQPIRSRSSLIASYRREASRSEAVRTGYALRWLELGRGVAATGLARARQRRTERALHRGRV